MASKITESLRMLLSRYRELPYVAVKKRNIYYLVPHRPKKPEQITFKIVSKKTQQKIDKYNQYFNSQKLRSQKATPEEIGATIIQQEDITGIKALNNPALQAASQSAIDKKSALIAQRKNYYKALEQFQIKNRQYDIKYKEPLELISITAYILFLRSEVRKLKLQKEKQQSQSNLPNSKPSNSQTLKTPKPQKTKKGIEKSEANISSMNKLQLPAKWRALTQQQKQVYSDMEIKLRQQNQKMIQEFIKNHEIPFKRRFSSISRFSVRYCSVHQLGIKDKKLYEIYHKLSASEKQMFKNEAMQMNQESRQRYFNFLNRWNLTDQKIKQIIQVSMEYKKSRKLKFKESRKKTIEQQSKYYENDQDDEDSEDLDDDNTLERDPQL